MFYSLGSADVMIMITVRSWCDVMIIQQWHDVTSIAIV